MESPVFIDNPVIRGREAHYATMTVRVDAVLQSWRMSLFSYEWLLPDGRVRATDELSASERPRREAVEEQLKAGTALEKPVLGIGLLENVEIGSGRAVFMTLAARGCKTMPVHIPRSNLSEFDPYRA